ncbi:MAG: hypothetical protein ACRDRL_23275, partial [Sciscionella sp.]
MAGRFGQLLTPTEVPEWDRSKLLLALTGVALAAAALLIGIALAIGDALHHPHPTAAMPTSTASSQAGGSAGGRGSSTAQIQAAALAAAPMQVVGADAAQPGPVSTRDPGTITVPAPTSVGPANVPSGFPHTVAG